MNKLIVLVAFCIYLNIYSQELPNYKDVTTELSIPINSLNLELRIPQTSFYIVIENDLTLSRYFNIDPCVALKSNFETNKSIQEILHEFDLLDVMYALNEEQLVRIDSNENIKNETALFFINIVYKTEIQSRSIYIPVFEKNISKRILMEFSQVFPNEKCFSILESKL